ncbi:MAG: DUF4199 domain-containing protein [Flavobacteriales bacterium]|nr:DUF4199 domain-containing protein [Flavobacteriales bacterium]
MKDYILKNGLVFGAISIILNSAAYSLGVDFFMSPALLISKIVIYVTVIIFLVLNFRKIIGGYISFKDTFSVSLGITAAGSFISTLFIILLFNFIDSNFAVLIKEATIEKLMMSLEQMPEGNAFYENIENSIDEIEKTNIYSVNNQWKALIQEIFSYSVISVIIALFIKKDKPIEMSE